MLVTLGSNKLIDPIDLLDRFKFFQQVADKVRIDQEFSTQA